MKSANRTIAILVAALALASVATSTMAHGDAPHLESIKGRHGGQLSLAGAYGYELTIMKDAKEGQDSPIVVYVTDHSGQKISTTGASGTATILAGKHKSTVDLKPDGDNRLKGIANYAATQGMKVVVSVTLAGKQPEQTRFTPMSMDAAKDGPLDHNRH